MVRAYQADVNEYRKKPDLLLTLPSSGPLEEYYYRKALAGNGLTAAEKQQLNAGAESLWQRLNQLDQTSKALETYVRLRAYQSDTLKKSDALMDEMLTLFDQFSREKSHFYEQIQRVYRHYQPDLPTDPYLITQKSMERVLLSQQQVLDSLPWYLNENHRSAWPVERVQQSMLADENRLSLLGKLPKVDYPASNAVSDFGAALLTMQSLKRRAVDEYTFTARRSARHGNAVYRALLDAYNQGLLASHHNFVNYSQSARQLLDYPAISPVISPELPPPVAQTTTRTTPFEEKAHPSFSTNRATAPAPPATLRVLNDYVDFINESLRQMHTLQGPLSDYQTSAEKYRDSSRIRQLAHLTYAHDDYHVPVSAYQLLLRASSTLPQPYRAALTNQAEVLLNILREMDGLSIELIAYTGEQQYLYDHLTRSDAILDRYAYLFDTFDQKKEQLYADLRRIHESYPMANPNSSWNRAGSALRKTLDEDKAILFGLKAHVKDETKPLPGTGKLEADARRLVADEYQNLKGLTRYGRNNGLCPYSPYEDLAENSLRFADMIQKVKIAPTTRPHTSFYFFYNNELVYPYNKFSELANAGLLRAINQPDVFAFRRLSPSTATKPTAGKTSPTDTDLVISTKPANGRVPDDKPPTGSTNKPMTTAPAQTMQRQRDTVYVERNRVDTVYLNRAAPSVVTHSLTGFAPNNMVLLLDVSGSMDSPVKLPLLKRAIKSLLTLLRPEDQISIVVYSGKARVVLKPTSGAKAADIARVIDELQSTGGTDGNEGLRLAYKTANKHYIRAGNNRIVLATDGEFPVSDEVLQLVNENARQDVYLTVFTFGRNPLTGQNLKKLSQLGRGTFAHVTNDSADLQLILEAQAIKQPLK